MQDFETPVSTEGLRHDFSKNPIGGKQPITYSAGKLDAVSVKMFFDGKIDKSDLLCGFRTYDTEIKQRVALNEFTAFVIGVYAGSFSNGKERGDINYQSNIVRDTRTDIIHSFYFIKPPGANDYKIETLAIGNYKSDIAPAIQEQGRNSSYTKVIVAYIKELDEVRAFHISSTAEAGFVKAIAKSQGTEEHKASLFRIGELASEIWAFRFSGEFEPVVFPATGARNVGLTVSATKEAKAIFFQPVLKAGVIRQTTEGWAEMFEKVVEMQEEFANYIESEQGYYRDRLDKKTGQSKQGPAQQKTSAQNYNHIFPPEPPTGNAKPADVPAGVAKEVDDLPF